MMNELTTQSPSFNSAIEITPIDTHTYTAFLREEWCIGTVPHGGYTTAVLHRLATTHFAHTHSERYKSSSSTPSSPGSGLGSLPDPISMQLTFLRRTSAGKAVLNVQDTKLGARTSTIHVTLSQAVEKPKKSEKKKISKQTQMQTQTLSTEIKDEDGQGELELELEAKVAGYITVSSSSSETGISAPTSWKLLPPAPRGSGEDGRVDFVKLRASGRDGVWGRVAAPFPEFRRAATHVELYGPTYSHSDTDTNKENKREGRARLGQVDQWARFCPGTEQGVSWTNEAVAYLVDMFPMALDGFDAVSSSADAEDKANATADGGTARPAKYWYPTVTLNVDFKQRLLPSQGVEWLYSRVQTRVVRDGRTDLDVVVLDPNGEVVALSTQVGLVVSSKRNIGTRTLKMGTKL